MLIIPEKLTGADIREEEDAEDYTFPLTLRNAQKPAQGSTTAAAPGNSLTAAGANGAVA